MKVLFLYSEVAPYFLECCSLLAEESEVHVVHWPVADEAPFKLSAYPKLKFYPRSTFGYGEMIRDLDPDLIIVSGWMDKGYIKAIRRIGKQKLKVLTIDNHWRGDLKQLIATLISPFTIKRWFDFAWVPGKVQSKFAAQLGFGEKQVQTGFYCADLRLFQGLRDKREAQVDERPRRFLYLGRYVQHKGIFDLWEAYKAYRNKGGDWELWCVGTGDQWKNRPEIEGLTHLGFKQPEEIPKILLECDAYILPSHFEPWGVSVQEMAAAGFPLILSDQIGSREQFLDDEKNGFSFQAGNKVELCGKLKRLAALEESQRIEFSRRSELLSTSITPQQWVKTLKSFSK